MAFDIVEQLIQESMKNVAGVDGRTAEDIDKIIVVIASKFAGDQRSMRSRAVEAVIPVGGVSVVVGIVVGLVQVLGLAS